jgi:hypothetical protein
VIPYMSTWDERMTRRPERQPRLDLVEACWQFVGPNSGRAISCAIYWTDVGLEVRACYASHDIVRTERVVDLGAGRALAAEWRQALIDKGFREMQAPQGVQ